MSLALMDDPVSAGTPEALLEMVVSSVPFEFWRSLWRIELDIVDVPGILGNVLTILNKHGLSLLSQETSSFDSRRHHRIEFIVAHAAAADGPPPEQIMRAVEVDLTLRCVDFLKIVAGQPRIRVSPMQGLQAAWKRFRHHARPAAAGVTGDVFHVRLGPHGVIALPEALQVSIGARGCSHYVMVSDTKERLLRVFFPRADQALTHVRVSYRHGAALKDITRALSRAFDVFSCLSRTHAHESRHDFEALLYCKTFRHFSEETERRTLIRQLLSDARLAGHELKIAFPKSIASSRAPEESPTAPSPHLVFSELTPDKLMTKSSQTGLAQWARDSRKRYEHPRRDLTADEQSLNKTRLAIVRRLEPETDFPALSVRVFVSYDFDNDDIIRRVEDGLRAIGRTEKIEVRAVTGKDMAGVFKQVIIDRIVDADAFLGVWTNKHTGQISPWLHWELGVAQSHSLPWELLKHSSVESKFPKSVCGDRQYQEYGDGLDSGEEFDRALKRAVSELLTAVRRRLGVAG